MATNPALADCRMTRSVSYFLVDDVFATAEFYRDVLGFTFDEFFGVPPSFVMVQRDDVNIMFRQVRPPKTPVARPNRTVMDETFDAYIYVSNVDQLAAELRAKRADIVEGPVDRIYDMRELLVRDCNGYVIAFGQG
jgi:catechol 2,3-dioxygenase-like lactoylglutathione lyase family enzyme